jgi:hypothetical protein
MLYYAKIIMELAFLYRTPGFKALNQVAKVRIYDLLKNSQRKIIERWPIKQKHGRSRINEIMLFCGSGVQFGQRAGQKRKGTFPK